MANEVEKPREGSSLGAASQLLARKAALQAKGGGADQGKAGSPRETLSHKPIDLPNEEWQKPKASGIAAAVLTAVVCIVVLVVAAVVLGGGER